MLYCELFALYSINSCVFFVLCFLLYTIASGSALAALTIECPSSVYEGETFIASIYSDEKLDTVTFEFLGEKVPVKARQENGKFRAWVFAGLWFA